MAVNRTVLIGLSVLSLTATISIALAQNTSNPMLSGNTTNPRLSGNTVTQGSSVPVSPAPNLTILGTPLGRNSFTGLPCTGPGQVAVTAGPGTAVGTIVAPGGFPTTPQNGAPITPFQPTSVVMPEMMMAALLIGYFTAIAIVCLASQQFIDRRRDRPNIAEEE